ncbi:PTS transporter subunit IIC [Lactobacillus sp. YT155]|uniref:PTS transporter subunit IIC n=1 Tax=Lactobacillus sp. YT155 TaxID=3060955 RepID=UPI00265F68A9|nr:PTS transporter subunit IIC [Lactobacillus sp. YT155]MDO1604924.1 PTS transporter subunit IIC [Lactobacillus sp. YT155]
MSMNEIVQMILSPGAQVVVPILIIILGLIFRMSAKKAVKTGSDLVIGFVGMSILIGVLVDQITPITKQLGKVTGLDLPAVDVGWTGAAAISWAWSLAFAFFALTIGINILMLLLKLTDTINADMWNVWGKVLTGYIVYYMSGGSYLWAFGLTAVQVIIELKLGDLWEPTISDMFGYQSTTTTHIESFTAVIMYPVNRLMDFIPIFNKEIDAKSLKKKIGLLSEPWAMGFIIGMLIGLLARIPFAQVLNFATYMLAIMALFPVVAKYFQSALSPFGAAMSKFMKARFKNRNFSIGLDWPIVGQSSELWVTLTINIIFFMGWAMVLPGNKVLPFAGIINYCLGVGGLLLTGGNLLRMIVLSFIYTPVFLYGATFLAPILTNMGKLTKAIDIPKGSMVTWSSIEIPELRIIFAYMTQGQWWAYVGFVALMGLFALMYRHIKKSPLPSERYKELS